MTEQQHPITPPPELVQQWRNAAPPFGLNRENWIATQAARWGAEELSRRALERLQELEKAVTDPTPLSPAAQAVLDAAREAWITKDDSRSIAAAALRAAAVYCTRERRILMTIADELENHQ